MQGDGFRCMHVVMILCVTAVAVGACAVDAVWAESALDPPRGPSDIPHQPTAPPDNPAQRFLIGFVLFFISIPVLALEMYTVYDPEGGYMLLRRHLKYGGDVQLTDFYLGLTRYGAVFGIILYSLFLIVSGYGVVLLLALSAIGLLYYTMERR